MLNPENLSTTIKLIPKTLKAKNRINEAGTDIWNIERVEQVCCCLRGKVGMLIQPCNTTDEKFRRWVCAKDDKDFDMEVLFN